MMDLTEPKVKIEPNKTKSLKMHYLQCTGDFFFFMGNSIPGQKDPTLRFYFLKVGLENK